MDQVKTKIRNMKNICVMAVTPWVPMQSWACLTSWGPLDRMFCYMEKLDCKDDFPVPS